MDATEDLRAAAQVALEAMGEPLREEADAKAPLIARLALDITVDGRTEMVTLSLRDGELTWGSSDGQRRGPHVVGALRLLAAGAGALPKGVRTSPGDLTAADGAGRSIPPADGRTSEPDPPSMKAALADNLDDLVTAIVRVGMREARDSPTVSEVVERFAQSAGTPMPHGAARMLGMLKAALSRMDVDGVARILDGATRLADDLRAETPSERSRRRLVTVLGASAGVPGASVRVSDRTFVEVGREYLSGMTRAQIERRYLLCVETGEVYREDRARGATKGSAGPSPRVLTVGLAEVEEGASPRAIRLLQYAVGHEVGRDMALRVNEAAKANFADITRAYCESLDQYPGLAEPFVVVAPARIEVEPGAHLIDRDGATLPVSKADGLGRAAVFTDLVGKGHRIDWVSGRLVDAACAPILVPCSVGYRADGVHRVLRLA
ncbi:MAG: hypothetical protein DRJ42_21135 [Deltaproteobacteria bacterium]|nr:MAG: hypothetical protein DRJ42_21135 [Deltaproteobacteria bacterium]